MIISFIRKRKLWIQLVILTANYSLLTEASLFLFKLDTLGKQMI